MVRRLLVGVAEAGELNEPRRFLLDHLELLGSLGVEVQVAMFEDGPVRRELERLADVRLMAELAPRSPGGLLQSAARRVSQDLADRVHDRRARADVAWIEAPDCVHVHGPKAAPVLRYWRDPTVPVTTYAHRYDFSIAGLQPLDLRRLLARTDRFIAVDDEVRADLVAAGVAPERIEPVPHRLLPPMPPPPASDTARLRAERGLPTARAVVGVMPVADWLEAPDLTLSLAWEVERLAGERSPVLYWYGMPAEGEPRWAIDFDVDRIGLSSLRLDTADVRWEELVELCDLIVLPVRTTGELPPRFAELAARRACPLACWEVHPEADQVRRWGGMVVEAGDVSAMARHVQLCTASAGALAAAREPVWRLTLAELETITPLSIPFPEEGR